jgi:hypothetical protein
VQGVYEFELRVTDNEGGIDRDTVRVTVSLPANQAPVANAGNDHNIILPVNTVDLTGTANDPDGTIASYLWRCISGPPIYTIENPTQAQTAVTDLVQGVYRFELRVTDNLGAIGRDTVNVIVHAADNEAPTANAGTDQSITLPTNTLTAIGAGNDPDGTIVSFAWSQISGPAASNIATPAQSQTQISNLVEGVYYFELTVTDNDGDTGSDTMMVTVHPRPNQGPTANAGTDRTITLPVNSPIVSGSGTDPDGTIVAYQWRKVSGPIPHIIVSPTSAQTSITALAQGIYQFELTVTDNLGATDKDTMQITVLPAPNQAPIANAGVDVSITLPVNSTMLLGSGTDPDGTIAGYLWTKVAGPSSYNIVSGTVAQTSVNDLAEGVYTFELRVTDNMGAIDRDSVRVIVLPGLPNQAPIANAGPDRNLTVLVNSTTLEGSGTDADGTIVSYLWRKISGPNTYSILSTTEPQTEVYNLEPGIYEFELTVTDNLGATGNDTMRIEVKEVPPSLKAAVYPNPAVNTDVINLTLTTTKPPHKVVIVIYDARGLVVHQQSVELIQTTTNRQIDISKFMKGFYVVKVSENAENTTSIKFIR